MLGIRLKPDEEAMLARHAQAVGRPKSVVARDWIMEGLQRDSIDEKMRKAAAYLAECVTPEERAQMEADTGEWLRMLDEEDGGYDWGPKGPPL